ncbi:hypothetical protein BGX24_012507 [Mortierella sp. AD032]|nr:hypothetical protein BGX24_012507 [Mortierella sp. AD032]
MPYQEPSTILSTTDIVTKSTSNTVPTISDSKTDLTKDLVTAFPPQGHGRRLKTFSDDFSQALTWGGWVLGGFKTEAWSVWAQGVLGAICKTFVIDTGRDTKADTLSSSSKGIIFCEYDLKLLLFESASCIIPPFGSSSIKIGDSPAGLLDQTTKAESELTFQVSLKHACGQSVRDVIQAFAAMDEWVEPIIFVVQENLARCGRTHEILNNPAVAIIAIHYLQKEWVVSNLFHE